VKENEQHALEARTAHPWHALDERKILELLDTDVRGLQVDEAGARLARYGRNSLRPPPRRGPFMRFLLQFHNVLIYVLIAASAVTAALGQWVDTGVILGVVIINAMIGFVQEGKAERALDAIRGMLSPKAMVRRGGRRMEIGADGLVPGDVVLLASGDRVPADLRLLQAKNLRIDEAALTGESQPVEKTTQPVGRDDAIGDRYCMAYSGTLVTYGQGLGVVVATGDATEIGRISGMLRQVQELTTPLLRQMATFGRWLSAAIVGVAVLTFAMGLLRGYTMAEMFLAAVGLAVAAIPEGLPAIMTITLAIGVQRMAGRNAIIRRLPAVETLGSVTVICSDKTGTLTRNEMTVKTVILAEEVIEVTGAGYAPEGGFTRSGEDLLAAAHPRLTEIARAAVLCNDAVLHERDGEWRLDGDPTEGALVTLALKAEIDPALEHEAFPRADLIPFESEHRFMATLHHDHSGHGYIYIKGAPERILEMCASERRGEGDRPLRADYWHDMIHQTAAAGQRVLAVAWREPRAGQRELSFPDVERGCTLLGMLGIMDPPREESRRAVKQCRNAGIRVKMITGDHAVTARAIAVELGIATDGSEVLTGAKLERMSDAQLVELAPTVDVFARASPEHKLRLVQALQSRGEIVAMTGDGVNDAPALKRADVGVAMGVKGTEAAKEAAEMVLADDNFASITSAVEEGRTVYDNLKKAIMFILPTNGGQAAAIIAAVVMGMALPITPVQILWVNMVTAVTLALALGFEPPEPSVMRRPPRDPREPLLSGFLVWRISFVSLLLVAGALGFFLLESARGASVEAARTVAVNTLVMCEVFYLFNSRHIHASVLSVEGITGNRYALLAVAVLLVLQLMFTYAPFAQRLFGTAPIGADEWLLIIAYAILVFLLVEGEKWLLRNRFRAAGSGAVNE
jgi:magnesium-transporting ATPase (P-type)